MFDYFSSVDKNVVKKCKCVDQQEISMNRVNPKLRSNLWDNIRAVANGLVANGHVVLIVMVCFGAFIMSRGMLGLAEMIDEPGPSEQPQLIENSEKIEKNDEQRDGPWEEYRQESDDRIEGHYQCASAEYRGANEEACVALDRHVAETIRRDSVDGLLLR